MTSSDTLKIVSLQPIITLHNLDSNLSNYDSLFEKYSEEVRQVDVLCFPEYWNGLRIKSMTPSTSKDSLEYLQSIALSFSCWVIGGSSVVKEGGRYYNQSTIIDKKGKLIGVYNKQRLFGYERIQELTAGDQAFFWNMNNFQASVCICNDLWNPKFIQNLIMKGIDIIFVPALTVVLEEYTNYGQFIWHNLAFARAKEGAMVVVVSDTAKNVLSDPFWSTGASCIVDPSQRFNNQESKGSNMITNIKSGEKGIISVNIYLDDIKGQKEYRKSMGLLDSE